MSDAATAATAARAVFTPSIVDCAWAVDARATNPGRADRGAELVKGFKDRPPRSITLESGGAAVFGDEQHVVRIGALAVRRAVHAR